jgi:hypothetical protein
LKARAKGVDDYRKLDKESLEEMKELLHEWRSSKKAVVRTAGRAHTMEVRNSTEAINKEVSPNLNCRTKQFSNRIFKQMKYLNSKLGASTLFLAVRTDTSHGNPPTVHTDEAGKAFCELVLGYSLQDLGILYEAYAMLGLNGMFHRF